MTHSIVIHQRPDFDCIGAGWLIERYLLPCAEIRFVRSGQTDETATAVVDTGGELDEARLRFDHHQLTGFAANTSATMQVYVYLLTSGHQVEHLHELMNLIDACDLGIQSQEANTSRTLGIHALLSARKAAGASDIELWHYGCSLLDDIAAGLLVRHNAQQEFQDSIAWSDEELGVVVLKPDTAQGVSFAAYDAGYDLVFFEGQAKTGGYVRGMMRRSGCVRYHCGNMVEDLMKYCEDNEWGNSVHGELATWFRHPAGFFAGISEKGGASNVPCAVPLVSLATLMVSNYAGEL